MVMFSARYCRLCKKMKREMSILKKKHGDDVNFGSLDAYDNPETGRHQEVFLLPSFVFYKAGKEIDRISGKEGTRKEIDAMMAKYKWSQEHQYLFFDD